MKTSNFVKSPIHRSHRPLTAQHRVSNERRYAFQIPPAPAAPRCVQRPVTTLRDPGAERTAPTPISAVSLYRKAGADTPLWL
ncbi:hypothetical protein EYF80_044180 [Liparis tanakae]|uniref:Uncharacterized protein n=1 Tax=Liparis tanakae TaxID=230148 RepID=A0A4Z2FYJ5_9TELE|nr:hypothetical protein EYF80_044180 [Liparis tanakae]